MNNTLHRGDDCEAGCLRDGQIAGIEIRVGKLEEIVAEVMKELRQKAVSDAEMNKTLELVLRAQIDTQKDVSELRTNMMSLVTDTLNKSREDVANILKMQEKNDEREREHKRTLEQKDKELEIQLSKIQMESSVKTKQSEMSFRQKVIVACISIAGTIILSAFGISKLIPIFK